MELARLQKLQQTQAGLRLFRADHMPLMAHFLYIAFIEKNRRSISLSTLEAELSEKLLFLNQQDGAEPYKQTARQYIDHWSHQDVGLLRKYYEKESDDPHLDLAPTTERAIEWLRTSLEERAFVGTESRLLTLFQQLQQFLRLNEANIEARVQELEEQKRNIEVEIERVKAGDFTPLTPTQSREWFFQIEETARRLLGDFRQVEQNFRDLDARTRERITLNDDPKGRVLDDIFGDENVIKDSEQGRSFLGFWEFLMSPKRQDELENMLERTYAREEIQSLSPDPFLRNVRYTLLEASGKVYQTNGRLIEQLRKFLDDREQAENRRIHELVRSIEKHAMALKGEFEFTDEFRDISEPRAEIDLPMSRGLFVPTEHPIVSDEPISVGSSDEGAESLYNQTIIDLELLKSQVRALLRKQDEVSLPEIVREFPLQHGVAEVVGYMSLANREKGAAILELLRDSIDVSKTELSLKLNIGRVQFKKR